MRNLESKVRAKARDLAEAIRAAHAGGLKVTWPHSPEGLSVIVINATAKVVSDPPVVVESEKPKLDVSPSF